MIKYVERYVERPEKVAVAIICDVCKKSFATDNWEETQEFLNINFIGGYGSVFGDTTHVEANICQRCLKEKLGPYLNFNIENQDDPDCVTTTG